MDRNDGELIHESLGDPELFGTLFDRHFLFVHRFCARRLDHARSEDIAGEVFRRAFERRNLYDINRADARPWLLGIALNLIRDTLRSSAVQQAAYRQLSDLDRSIGRDLDEQVASQLDAERAITAVGTALEQLPVEEVETLLLYCWENLTYAEVAQALEIPIGTVRSRLNRARQRLHVLIGEPSPRSGQLPATPRGGSDG